MMDVRPLRTEADYQWAIQQIEAYFDDQPAVGSPDGDRFDVLATLIEAYENRHHSIPAADPVQILHYAIEDLGRSQTELADLLGSRSRASEILNRKRCLTIEQAHRISTAWNLPLELLAVPYRIEQNAA
ncbi:helix-turn-helix domain-containing protein [Methylobacterium fujisawaense]|uniref:helix-turn-helix domain-containing protein n=1 Tax=Methylobacterium fujisawaense TaxID=107400 RepID=UPI003CE9A390